MRHVGIYIGTMAYYFILRELFEDETVVTVMLCTGGAFALLGFYWLWKAFNIK